MARETRDELERKAAAGSKRARLRLRVLSDASRMIEVVGISEIAQRIGVNRLTVKSWHERGHLPRARWRVSGQPAWEWADVRRHLIETGRIEEGQAPAQVVELAPFEVDSIDRVVRDIGREAERHLAAVAVLNRRLAAVLAGDDEDREALR